MVAKSSALPIHNFVMKLAVSILDYIFRELAISYQNREDLAHTPSINGNDRTFSVY